LQKFKRGFYDLRDINLLIKAIFLCFNVIINKQSFFGPDTTTLVFKISHNWGVLGEIKKKNSKVCLEYLRSLEVLTLKKNL